MFLLIASPGCQRSKVTYTESAPLEKVAKTSDMTIYRLRLGSFSYLVVDRYGGGTAIIAESKEPEFK